MSKVQSTQVNLNTDELKTFVNHIVTRKRDEYVKD